MTNRIYKISCPFCKDAIPSNALRCQHCTSDLTSSKAKDEIQKQVKAKINGEKAVAVVVIILFGLLVWWMTTRPATQENQPPVNQPQTSSTNDLTPEKLQAATKSMAEFMVKDSNRVGLRMWAKSLGQTPPNGASAETIYASIKATSNDFALYRSRDELLKLIQILADQQGIFDETLLQAIRDGK